jgi:hypothetical protein
MIGILLICWETIAEPILRETLCKKKVTEFSPKKTWKGSWFSRITNSRFLFTVLDDLGLQWLDNFGYNFGYRTLEGFCRILV